MKNIKTIVMLMIVFFHFLLMIRYLHNFHVKETYTEENNREYTSMESVTSSYLDANINEPEYIEITDTIYVEPKVPVNEVTCEPRQESFNKINVDEIHTHTEETQNIDFMNDVNINGTLNVNKIKMNDKVLFTYDTASKTLKL